MQADTRSPQHKPRLASMGRVTIAAKGSKVTTQQQTERERLADMLEGMANGGPWRLSQKDDYRKAAALLRGDEPAKPDRYVQVAREVGALLVSKGYLGGLYDNEKNFQAAAAVLRKHFAPPSEVVEAAKSRSADHPLSAPGIMRDHILKGGA